MVCVGFVQVYPGSGEWCVLVLSKYIQEVVSGVLVLSKYIQEVVSGVCWFCPSISRKW